jgi:amidase
VPFLLKDLDAHSAGDPYHCGIHALKKAGWQAEGDSHLAAKFRNAGPDLSRKDEHARARPGGDHRAAAYGPSRNPWNPSHSTGGSSGSAAAVASGMVPAAHQRWRRLDSHPGERVRARRAEALPGRASRSGRIMESTGPAW